ncbi:MAG: NACHT domain-containing protein [Anaerolineaceae bacterium]
MLAKGLTMPGIDPFSLILGLIFGVLIAFLTPKLISILPKKEKKSRKEDKQTREESLNDLILRKYLLRHAQSQHLGSDLCSLDDVYVQQKLFPHPVYSHYEGELEEEPLFFRDPLFLLDVPELIGDFPFPQITLEEALSTGCSLIIQGNIGSGKTTLLSAFISRVLEHKCEMTELNEVLPVYLHIQDVLRKDSPNPLAGLLALTMFKHGLDLNPAATEKLFNTYLSRQHLMLIIDGLDELPQSDFDRAVEQIGKIHAENPSMRMVTVSGPFYTGKLQAIGFRPVTLKPPDGPDYDQLYEKWALVWKKLHRSSPQEAEFDHAVELVRLWLQQEPFSPTYFTMTTSILSALNHDSLAEDTKVITYLREKTNDLIPAETFVRIAESIASGSFAGISVPDLKSLVNLKIDSPTDSVDHKTEFDALELLIHNHLLIENDDRIFFSSPSIFCRLLANSAHYRIRPDVNELRHNPVLNFTLINKDISRDYLITWASEDGVSNAPMIIQHLVYMRNQVPDFKPVLQQLASRLISQELPLSAKIKIGTIILYAHQALFNQLLQNFEKNKSIQLQQFCAFFYAFDKTKTHLEFLVECINSQNESLSLFGLIGLCFNEDYASASSMLTELLRSNQASTSRLAAEVLSQNKTFGHTLLKTLSTDESPICRRNVIYGLRLISEAWADQTLSSISTDDNVWIVRDAAAQALENKWDPKVFSPHPSIHPSEDQQLVTIASQHGLGVTANRYPYELLYDLFNSNNFGEALIALQYLTEKPDAQTITTFQHAISRGHFLREILCDALFFVSLAN